MTTVKRETYLEIHFEVHRAQLYHSFKFLHYVGYIHVSVNTMVAAIMVWFLPNVHKCFFCKNVIKKIGLIPFIISLSLNKIFLDVFFFE